MEAAARPYAMVGAALAGASLIAVTPIAPPPDLHRVASAAVRLTTGTTDLISSILGSDPLGSLGGLAPDLGSFGLGGLFADGSPLNIPYNIFADIVNIPYYESLALQEYAYAMGPAGSVGGVPGWIPTGTNPADIVGNLYGVGGTGSWWMESMGNTWGWDNGNWPQLDAISHFLFPFQFTEDFANQFQIFSQAELIDGAHIGCEFECANPLGYLLGWAHGATPLASLFAGTTFPNTIYGANLPVTWAGQPGAQLNLLEPLQAIASNLTASPASNPIQFPDPVNVFDSALKLGQDLVNDFNPFVTGSFLYWGLPTDYSIPTLIGGTIQDFTGIPNQFGFPADQLLGSEPVWGQTAGPLDLLTRLPQAFGYFLDGNGGQAGNGILGYLNPEIYLQALGNDFHLWTNLNDFLAASPLVGYLGLGNPDVFAPGSLLGTLGPAVMNGSVPTAASTAISGALLSSFGLSGLLSSFDLTGLLNSFDPTGLLSSFDLTGLLNSFDPTGLLGTFDPATLLGDVTSLLPNAGADLASMLGTNLGADLTALLPNAGADLATMLGTNLGADLSALLPNAGADLATMLGANLGADLGALLPNVGANLGALIPDLALQLLTSIF